MFTKKNTFVFIAFSLLIENVMANRIPTSVYSMCTTNSRIYNQKSIHSPMNLSKKQKRVAVLKALGIADSSAGFAVKNFKGQWFYEHDSEDAIFASYTIRSHYLNVAVIYTPQGLDTIICNSTNLKQTAKSIHRKAPVWKDTLDNNIRIELSDTARFSKPTKKGLAELKELHSIGVVTDKEFSEMKKRIEKM